MGVAASAGDPWLYTVDAGRHPLDVCRDPQGFLPVQDTGLLLGVTDAAQDISFAAMAERQRQVADIIRHDPDVVAVDSFVGVGTVNSTLNSGRLYIDIGSPDRGRASAEQIMERLHRAVAAIPGIALHLQPVQDVTIETRASRTQYQYVLQDLDPAELSQFTARLVAALRNQPAIADAASDQEEEGLQLMLTIDRAAAARYGITLAAIDQTLYDAFGQRQIATIYGPLTQYHVILELDAAQRDDLGVLNRVYITQAASTAASSDESLSGVAGGFSQASPAVPLGAVVRAERRLAPLAITHQGLFPATTISFNLAPGASLSQAIGALHNTEREIGLPDTVTANFSGAAAEFEASLRNEGWLIAAAIVTVYIVLGVLYESFIHPITILSTLPSAGVGALFALMLFGLPLDLISLIGIILLIGIVKKNAIMMVDFALDAQRRQGMSPEQAIRQACQLRFRPIMMTTMAALLGALPLAVGTGTGAELRQPLGIAIVGGLLLSQFLTLFTTPVIYLGFCWLQQRFRQTLRAPA